MPVSSGRNLKLRVLTNERGDGRGKLINNDLDRNGLEIHDTAEE
jgi:hypothetical protein